MLFPYQYINHSMEKIQDFIDYIFYEVWCKAPRCTDYSFDLYNNKPELKEVVTAFHYSSTKEGDFFNAKIEEIFLIFKPLNPDEICQLKKWYLSNNNIKGLCKNDPTIEPSTYSDVNQLNAALGNALKTFFIRLYSKDLLSLKALSDKIGLIDEHYEEFLKKIRKANALFAGYMTLTMNMFVHETLMIIICLKANILFLL